MFLAGRTQYGRGCLNEPFRWGTEGERGIQIARHVHKQPGNLRMLFHAL